mmetsp:Transcript_2411/g.7350  ORF Transcript_2411/g.7350 Transcript_2411/m.7350 type:complete len:316 (+) Transcript_2411:627-1574(+)
MRVLRQLVGTRRRQRDLGRNLLAGADVDGQDEAEGPSVWEVGLHRLAPYHVLRRDDRDRLDIADRRRRLVASSHFRRCGSHNRRCAHIGRRRRRNRACPSRRRAWRVARRATLSLVLGVGLRPSAAARLHARRVASAARRGGVVPRPLRPRLVALRPRLVGSRWSGGSRRGRALPCLSSPRGPTRCRAFGPGVVDAEALDTLPAGGALRPPSLVWDDARALVRLREQAARRHEALPLRRRRQRRLLRGVCGPLLAALLDARRAVPVPLGHGRERHRQAGEVVGRNVTPVAEQDLVAGRGAPAAARETFRLVVVLG